MCQGGTNMTDDNKPKTLAPGEAPITAGDPLDTLRDVLGRNKVIGLRNAGRGVNPKDRVGSAKVDLSLFPGAALVQGSLALMEGANKYGAYNWRVEPVLVRTYAAAILRHIQDFLNGEDYDCDSGVLILGHILANAAILVDSMFVGTYVDDRPIKPKNAPELSALVSSLNAWIKDNKPAEWGK